MPRHDFPPARGDHAGRRPQAAGRESSGSRRLDDRVQVPAGVTEPRRAAGGRRTLPVADRRRRAAVRSVKYEEVCLRDYADGWEPEKSLRRCFDDSRNERIHQTLGYRTPAAVYAGGGRVRAQFSVETNSERSDVKRHPVRELIRARVRPLEWISRATIPTPPSPRRKSFQRMRSTSVAHLRFVISVHSHAVLSGAVAGGCHRPIHKRNPP
jgi:hypothetical protein